MDIIKIRSDKVDFAIHYNCNHCNKSPKNNDVIIRTEINYEYLTFCSEECMLAYLKNLGDVNDVFVRCVIKVYDPTPTQELDIEISNMKPNTKLDLEDGRSVEYFETPGLKKHYLLNNYMGSKLFNCSYELANYINRKSKGDE